MYSTPRIHIYFGIHLSACIYQSQGIHPDADFRPTPWISLPSSSNIEKPGLLPTVVVVVHLLSYF